MPLAKGSVAEVTREANLAGLSGCSETILVAEDVAVLSKLATTVLHDNGNTVIDASDSVVQYCEKGFMFTWQFRTDYASETGRFMRSSRLTLGLKRFECSAISPASSASRDCVGRE